MNSETDTTDSATGTAVPEALDLQLRKPVTYAKTEYSVLHLTEPTAGQIIKASKAGNVLEQGAMLIHLNAAVPMAVVEQLSQRDFEAAADFFSLFSTLEAPPNSAGASPE